MAASKPRLPSTLLPLLAIFWCSGFSGLGCQMVWTRQLGLGLGHEAASTLAVITAYFGGLALGAWGPGRGRWIEVAPGLTYAGLEAVIGVWVWLSPWLVPGAAREASAWIGPSPGPIRQWALTFGVTFLVLLPATAAMGATLPAMERFGARATGDAKTLGPLYAANTLGAVVGTCAGAFWLIPALGFRHSLLGLGCLNFVSALGALAIRRSLAAASGVDAAAPKPQARPGADGRRSVPGERWGWATLAWFALATGFLGIGVEVAGMRLLAQALANTVYTYAVVLAVFLLATAAGAGLERRIWLGQPAPRRLHRLLLGLALSVTLSTWVLRHLLGISRYAVGVFGSGRAGEFLGEFSLAAAVFVPPGLLMGMTFALLATQSAADQGGLGGWVSWNMLGAATAPVGVAVVLIPTVGTHWTLAALSLGYAGLAWPCGPRQRTAWVAAAVLALQELLPGQFQLIELPAGARVVEYREGAGDTVAVIETPDAHRSLRVNQRFAMGGTASANAERRQAHLPLLLHENPRRALFLGAGTGITLGAVVDHAGLTADGVELVPEVEAVLGRFAPENRRDEWPSRVTYHVEDARRFVANTEESYDVIVADLFHPARDGAASLYTLEHFRAMRARLRPGGIVCQWLPLHQLDQPTLACLVRTFLEAFPHAQAFLLRLTVDTPVIGLIGTLEPGLYSPGARARVVPGSALAEALRPLSLGDELQWLGQFVAGPAELRAWSGRAALNTDDRPLVLFLAPRRAWDAARRPYDLLFELLARRGPELSPPLSPAAAVSPWREKLAAYLRARDVYLAGLRADAEGFADEAIRLFLASVGESPDFTTGYAHCLTLAVQVSRERPDRARTILERLVALQPGRGTAAELLRRLDESP